MKFTLVEHHQIKKNHSMYKFLNELCSNSKSVWNMSNYIVRQEYIKNKKWIRWTQLDKILRDQYPECYKLLPAKSTQKTLKQIDDSWKSFFQAKKAYIKDTNKFTGVPRLPGYKDKLKGRNSIIFTNQQCQIKNEILKFPLHLIKGKNFSKIKTKIKDKKLCQVEIIPKKNYLVISIVYEEPKVEIASNEILNKKTGEILQTIKDRTYSIDLGINNFCTVTNNFKDDFFIFSGKQIKSINQWSNKYQSFNIAQHKKNRVWQKRKNQIDYHFHKMTNLFIDKCIDSKCKNIVVGYNQVWKQNVNLGRKVNQNFVQIPFDRFLNILEYKCIQRGIEITRINESYTSKCSFLDNESIEKHEEYKGKRIKRGLFRSSNGLLINSDINGSLNILSKFSEKYLQTNFGSKEIEGVVVHPYKVHYMSNQPFVKA
jgi:putative transposase